MMQPVSGSDGSMTIPNVRLTLVREGNGSGELPLIRCPGDAAELLMPLLRDEPKEKIVALLLDTRHRVLCTHTVSVGTINCSPLVPAEVLKAALLANAAAVIVAHNHRSGDPEPSTEDRAATKRLQEAGRVVGVELLDHLVIGDGRWVSLKERGEM
jgi:DNA repair protein RadC